MTDPAFRPVCAICDAGRWCGEAAANWVVAAQGAVKGPVFAQTAVRLGGAHGRVLAMKLEDALNMGLPPHHVTLCNPVDGVAFRAEIVGYPQCTGFGATANEAVRTARHLYTQLRDGQTAVTVSELEDDGAARLREAMRFVVTRALV